MYKEIFTEKLRYARKQTNYTQKEASEEIGIPRSTLANYEAGKTEPDIETIGKLAEYYNVSIDWLFGIGKK